MPKAKKKPLISSHDEANAVLRRLAELDRDCVLINSGLNEKIDRLKADAVAELKPIVAQIKEFSSQLKSYATSKKEDLGEKKSIKLSFGVFGFRQSTQLKLAEKGQSWKEVLANLERLDLGGVKTSKTLDKETLEKWPEDKLSLIGVKTAQVNSFFCEPSKIKTQPTN